MDRVKRNKLLLAVLAVALFIPTVVAIINYSRSKSGPVDSKSIVWITVTDLDGELIVDKGDENTKEVVDMFVNINEGADQVAALPDVLGQNITHCYNVVMSNGSDEFRYNYYFDITGGDTYYTDKDNLTYRVKAGKVVDFLETKYAASLYKEAAFPVFSISAENKDVKPVSAVWTFKSAGGNLVDLDCSGKLTKNIDHYDIIGGIEAKFDIDPDFIQVDVVDSATGQSLISRECKNGEPLMLEGSVDANVDVLAKWYHDEAHSYEGEIKYSFTVSSAQAAQFYIGNNTIESAEFVAVTGVNVIDPDKVEFSSEPSLGFTPHFYKNGDYVYTIIPVPLDAPSVTGFKLTFKYGAVTQDIDLTVNYRNYERKDGNTDTYTVSEEKAALYTDANIKAAEDVLKPVLEKVSESDSFKGEFFVNPVNGTWNRYFGRTYNIVPGDISYRQSGIEFGAAEGTNAVAAGAGKVVFVGETAITGNVVIIDHGYGLKTMYSHLASTAVSVGDEVAQGAAIGTCGSTGFCNGSGVYYSTYVGGVNVTSYNLMNDSENWKPFPLIGGEQAQN